VQLATAAFFVVETLFSVLTALSINHDSMLRVIRAQGTSIPAGMDIDTIVTLSVFLAWAVVVVVAVLELVAALGSYLGWRWMFWAALVLLGFGAIGAFTNLSSLAHASLSPIPTWGLALEEVFSIAALALFIWMLIGVIRFGPWAM